MAISEPHQTQPARDDAQSDRAPLRLAAALEEGQPDSTMSAPLTAQSFETVLNLEPSPGNPRNSEGDFIQLNDGRLLLIYTHFTGSASDFGAAHLASRYSGDGGATWSTEDEVVIPNEGGMNVMSVSLLRLADGRIGLMYLRKNSRSDCRPYFRTSSDEGQTWSEPVLVIHPLGYFVGNNDRLLQLDSGRLVYPVSRHSMPGEDFSNRGQAMAYLSDDAGATWYRSDTILTAPAESKSGFQEPGIATTPDDGLLMFLRIDLGSQYLSRSTDGGVTWTGAEPSVLASPVSPATIEPLPGTDTLVAVWNDHRNIDDARKGKRTPLTLAQSTDGGATWTEGADFETAADGWYCYTAMTFTDTHLLLAYCAGDEEVGRLNRLRITRIPLAEL